MKAFASGFGGISAVEFSDGSMRASTESTASGLCDFMIFMILWARF